MSRIYNIVQYLSLDVALGSAASSLLAVRVLSVKLPWAYWTVLPLCVWMIYTTDHLLDAIKGGEKITMARHRVHRKYRYTFGLSLIVSGTATALLIRRYLEERMILFGAVILLLIVVYLGLNFLSDRIFRMLPRELIIASGYMLGTWGIPFMVRSAPAGRAELLLFAGHACLILSIPLLYGWFEYADDRAAGFVSFATTYGLNTTATVVWTLLLAGGISALCAVTGIHRIAGMILLGMTLLLVIAVAFRNRLYREESYRKMIEPVTFLPFIFLFTA